ncbi:hypothetical protein PG991_010809 [Apiospora marii]|uniref:Helix-turn-helix DNA binding domain protein n=1 Tax=Apiospora marii TaxID=335849 RepID=A0ABR1RCB5_9PEZI
MADQSNKSTANPDFIDFDALFLMSMIETNIGFDSDKFSDDHWAKYAAACGMSVPYAKRIFGEGKEQYFAAKRGEIPIKGHPERGTYYYKSAGPSQDEPAQQAGKEKSKEEQHEGARTK